MLNISSIVKFLIPICVSIGLAACAEKWEPGTIPRGVTGVPDPTSAELNTTPKIRYAGLQESATSFGAQSGLAWASRGLNKSLEDQERRLNEVFNFRLLILNNNVLPPVLSEGNNALDIDNPDALRMADKVYKIESPPRFVTAAPTWRDYLWMNYTPPEKPNAAMLPHDNGERRVWDQYYKQGWEAGIMQANQIFSENMGRLKRDYAGMILYRKLLNEHMVTAPFVAKSDLGITGDGNQLRINDQVLRITTTSQLVKNSKVWKPAVVPGVDGAVRKQGSDGTETVEN